MNYLIVIIGPTAIGKTDLSINLAKHFKTEIISADSRQIFRELTIGTATPNSQQLNTVKHHLIKTHSIIEKFNASVYESNVLSILNNAFLTKKTMVLTGGSMMYIDAVCNGIDEIPNIPDNIRTSIYERLNTEGLSTLVEELKVLDPEYHALVDLQNPKRILHALEIYYSTGRPYSSFRKNIKKTRPFKIIKIGLNSERNLLHSRINERVDQMIKDGLMDEAKSLYHLKHLNALNTVGYKELFQYFDKKIDLDETIRLIKRNSRHYARKQLTWFRKDQETNWFDITNIDLIIPFIESKIV